MRAVNRTKQGGDSDEEEPYQILAETGKVSCFAALLLCAGNVQAGEPKYKVDASQFKCITKLTSVKHFFVDNLAGNLAGTVDVATAGKGQFPEGSVLQLIPNEVMVKQQKGFSPGTNDWEFFALALQLPFCFEVGSLSGSLVSSAPE